MVDATCIFRSKLRNRDAVIVMKKLLLTLLVLLLYLLHQDFWHWRVAHPIVFGLFPIGYFYHLVYTLVVALVMWLLVRHAWPAHLEDAAGKGEDQ